MLDYNEHTARYQWTEDGKETFQLVVKYACLKHAVSTLCTPAAGMTYLPHRRQGGPHMQSHCTAILEPIPAAWESHLHDFSAAASTHILHFQRAWLAPCILHEARCMWVASATLHHAYVIAPVCRSLGWQTPCSLAKTRLASPIRMCYVSGCVTEQQPTPQTIVQCVQHMYLQQ